MIVEAVRPEPVDTVVLAGSINRIPLYPGARPGRKALVELHGKPLIAYVLDALHGARSVGRILVVGAPDVVEFAGRWPKVEGVPEGHRLVRNAHRGLLAARTNRVLFCNPDQPLLRAEMVDYFVDRALVRDAHLVTSWVRHEVLGRYVEGDHKFADFGDGRYAHGNLLMLRRDLPHLPKVRDRLDRMYQARKNRFHFAWELGPTLFLRFLATFLRRQVPTLEETQNIIGKHFGVTLAAVVCPYPEIVLDIDEPEDYEAAERYLSEADPKEPSLCAA
jgi:CTP:molybdopterin cytidylyltransferase MocA